MKCPKCDYLGFEASDRCRNCGYEFALARPALADSLLDVSLSPAGAEPLIPSSDAQPFARPPLDLDRVIGGTPDDLPLFPARPRAPLGVRRATPEIPRARIQTPRPAEETLFEPPAAVVSRSSYAAEDAAPASRMMAAVIDGALLLAVNIAVLYFTLRLCGLTPLEIFQLPAAPLLAFFLLLDGGYFVAFTAVGGQSIGKMALGIKVVGEEDRPVPVGKAALRTLAYGLSALPLGAGFVAGVLGADRLALHDRLTHTRVIRPTS